MGFWGEWKNIISRVLQLNVISDSIFIMATAVIRIRNCLSCSDQNQKSSFLPWLVWSCHWARSGRSCCLIISARHVRCEGGMWCCLMEQTRCLQTWSMSRGVEGRRGGGGGGGWGGCLYLAGMQYSGFNSKADSEVYCRYVGLFHYEGGMWCCLMEQTRCL